jgi:acetyl esterase/lipase
MLWIHGGGFVSGDPKTYHDICSRIAKELDILVVSVDYRLAPEHPFPAGLDDCYAALEWIHRQAAGLGVDPGRVAIGGDSAGGGLAACLAQLAHDRGELPVGFQLLVYPMLDDRTVLRAEHGGTGGFVWTPASNRYGWTAYLGHAPGDAETRPYAAASRREDLSGLPPAWIGVGDLDLFHSEDLIYAERLKVAGVDCELVEIPGMYHGADSFFDGRAESMTLFRKSMLAALRRGVAARRGPRGPAAGPRQDRMPRATNAALTFAAAPLPYSARAVITVVLAAVGMSMVGVK